MWIFSDVGKIEIPNAWADDFLALNLGKWKKDDKYHTTVLNPHTYATYENNNMSFHRLFFVSVQNARQMVNKMYPMCNNYTFWELVVDAFNGGLLHRQMNCRPLILQLCDVLNWIRSCIHPTVVDWVFDNLRYFVQHCSAVVHAFIRCLPRTSVELGSVCNLLDNGDFEWLFLHPTIRVTQHVCMDGIMFHDSDMLTWLHLLNHYPFEYAYAFKELRLLPQSSRTFENMSTQYKALFCKRALVFP